MSTVLGVDGYIMVSCGPRCFGFEFDLAKEKLEERTFHDLQVRGAVEGVRVE